MKFYLPLAFFLTILANPLSGQLRLATASCSDLACYAQLSRDYRSFSQENLLPGLEFEQMAAPSNLSQSDISSMRALPALLSLMASPIDHSLPNGPEQSALRYRSHLAFFCRVELKIDQAIGTPFRFRLGSVDYVDYLEGKRKNY